MRVLVTGATGYLGRHVVQVLAARGHTVRALGRTQAGLDALAPHVAEPFLGQATDDNTLEGLCDGVDVVFSSLGIRAFSGAVTYEHVDYQANINVLRRAEAAKVSCFAFVSVLHGDRVRTQVPQVDARERVVDALEASELPGVVFRPTGFYNDMGEFFEMAQRGSVWLIGDGSVKINPIHGADLAAFIVDTLDDPSSLGQSFDIGGPEVFTLEQIARLALETASHPDGAVHHLPTPLVDAAAALTTPFSANLSNGLRFFAAVSRGDAVAPATGSHRLKDFYASLASSPA